MNVLYVANIFEFDLDLLSFTISLQSPFFFLVLHVPLLLLVTTYFLFICKRNSDQFWLKS